MIYKFKVSKDQFMLFMLSSEISQIILQIYYVALQQTGNIKDTCIGLNISIFQRHLN